MAYGFDGRGSIPGRGKIFFSTLQRLDRLWAPTQPPVQWTLEALSPGVRRLGREADQSHSSNVKADNGGAIPPLPHTSSSRDA
jgi:hypothetical protein